MRKLHTKRHTCFTCRLVLSWSPPPPIDAELILDIPFQWAEWSFGSCPVWTAYPQEMASWHQITASTSWWHCPWSLVTPVCLFHLCATERRKGVAIQRRQGDLSDEKVTVHVPANPNTAAAVPTETGKQVGMEVSTNQTPKCRYLSTGSWELPLSTGVWRCHLRKDRVWRELGAGFPGQNQGQKSDAEASGCAVRWQVMEERMSPHQANPSSVENSDCEEEEQG